METKQDRIIEILFGLILILLVIIMMFMYENYTDNVNQTRMGNMICSSQNLVYERIAWDFIGDDAILCVPYGLKKSEIKSENILTIKLEKQKDK